MVSRGLDKYFLLREQDQRNKREQDRPDGVFVVAQNVSLD